MEPPAAPQASNPETILFRPSKKRKIYRRQRDAMDNDEAASSEPTQPAPAPAQTLEELIASPGGLDAAHVEGTAVPIAEILRLRKQRRARVGGVEFRAVNPGGRDEGGGRGLVVRDGEGEDEKGDGETVQGQVRRFAPQTGLIGDVSNKHMMAYIDSELAKRSSASALATNHAATTSSSYSQTQAQAEQKRKEIEEVQRQPAALGKLLEIDLGDEARDRNVERTNQAWRRLAGEEVEEDSDGNVKKGGKIRLGRDGKPWRGRKRRGSDDVKRDKLVEDILKENRLEIYDEPAVQERTVNDDQAADDRIAEDFRREFMDAINQRQSKKVAPAPPASRGPGGKVEEELMKGPKLGGSRQARAAMREAMLKNIKK